MRYTIYIYQAGRIRDEANMRCTPMDRMESSKRREAGKQRYEHKTIEIKCKESCISGIYISRKCLLAYETVQGTKEYIYISRGSCVRASRPLPRCGFCASVFVALRAPNPPFPGPRGCLTTPLTSFRLPFIEPITLEGRLGTGGTEVLPKLLPNKDPKPPGERRDGEAMVA